MPIVLRSQKGASLTFTELDGNFIDLNQRVGDISERISTIESDTVTWDEIENKPNTLDGFGLDEAFDGNYNNLINKPTIPSLLTDLSNVSNTVVPNTGQVLKWDGNQWAPADEEAGTGSAVDLTAFTVSVHPPEEAPNLTYDNETGQFQYTPPNLALYALASSLSTVAASGDYSDLANTPSLATVATTGNYSDLTGKPAIPFNIGDLNNVSSTSPTVGQALTWNGSTWSPSTVSTGDGGGATTLDGLSDVSTTGVANNNILKYNGTTSAWEIGSVNYTEILNTPTIPSDINELSDNDGLLTIPTDISDLTDNTNLLFDGTYGSLTGSPTSLGFPAGVAITEFSSDGTLADNSSSAVPTESAVKTYVDTTIGDFTFTNTTLDTTGSAAITVTPDVTFNGTVTVNSFSSAGTGNLLLSSAASVNITATDDVNINGTANFDSIVKLTPLSAAPTLPAVGSFAVADRTNWDPASKGSGNAYPVFYDGTVWQALY